MASSQPDIPAATRAIRPSRVSIQFNICEACILIEWIDPATRIVRASGRVQAAGQELVPKVLRFSMDDASAGEHRSFPASALAAESLVQHVRSCFELEDAPPAFSLVADHPLAMAKPGVPLPLRLPMGIEAWYFLRTELTDMGKILDSGRYLGDSPWERGQSALRILCCLLLGIPEDLTDTAAGLSFQERRAIQRARRQHEQREKQEREEEAKSTAKSGGAAGSKTVPSPKPSAAAPPVDVVIELPPLCLQDTALPLTNLGRFALTEQAARWWIANQSDDLLCLPNCRITRLDYQVRTALRVLGPLRGRALLSDEVGLGKTIEAGLIIKELLTRGMVKRFLVLTVPSLVDQWEEELSDKFGLQTVTTNHPESKAPGGTFWSDHVGIVASLHTLKQAAQLEVARQVHWDILVVDEAHYLRNRDSLAWQAVNVLPRRFMLLLTATPVQNSLEELYNLVTLLQPGQLPNPKEFRARYFDPKRPRQPLEPEELRRLLSQVMIRNTRSNSGIDLPPRRAETVLFTADDAERHFWEGWESELRGQLALLSPGPASLWGRLLLQAAGSSPAAWKRMLHKFPDRSASARWQKAAPLDESWRRKCELLPPLARGEGGVVIFSQFLETQAALVDFLKSAGVKTFFVNGSTPAAERQPITEAFREQGGALLLTHSGTEGRNLQFCHRLVNFDLPWNPMEIEQRIGRLHRLGQKHPVRIYNFVQSGTLQEHLLEILQEKLNLFELVVGETGLVLGERFGSDEFAEEILRRWRDNEGRVADAFAGLGEELAAARDQYSEIKKLDQTLFAKDYESL